MAFDRIAESKIRELIEAGGLDNLPNKGQRLDLEDYFKAPSELRMAYSILKSAGCVPEEVELLNEITRLPDGPEKEQARLQLAVLQERHRRRR